MTHTPALPPLPVPGASEGPSADVVLADRALTSADYLAGLILAGQLDTVGTPRMLPRDLFPDFPDADPALVQAVWNRALVVGVRAGQLMAAPRFYRDKLARLRGELETAGDRAMAGLVGRPLSVAERAPEWHPADEETGREH